MLIYKITNKTNSKVYVGRTKRKLKERWSGHTHRANAGSKLPIHNAIRKHGKENFSIEAIYECKTENEMIEKETFFIKEHNSVAPNGYNVLERDECLSTWWKGKKQTAEHTDKIRQKFLPRVEEMKNCHSKEWVAIDPNGKVYKFKNLEEFCRKHVLERGAMTKVASSKYGSRQSKGWSCFYAEDYKGQKGYKKTIYEIISPDGKLLKIDSPAKFARENGLDSSNFVKFCKGKQKSCKGYSHARQLQ